MILTNTIMVTNFPFYLNINMITKLLKRHPKVSNKKKSIDSKNGTKTTLVTRSQARRSSDGISDHLIPPQIIIEKPFQPEEAPVSSPHHHHHHYPVYRGDHDPSMLQDVLVDLILTSTNQTSQSDLDEVSSIVTHTIRQKQVTFAE